MLSANTLEWALVESKVANHIHNLKHAIHKLRVKSLKDGNSELIKEVTDNKFSLVTLKERTIAKRTQESSMSMRNRIILQMRMQNSQMFIKQNMLIRF